MRLSSPTGNLVQRVCAAVLNSRPVEPAPSLAESVAVATPPAPFLPFSFTNQSGTDVATATDSAATAPLAITSCSHAALIEYFFHADAVLKGSECLLHLKVLSLSLYLRLEREIQDVQTEKNRSVQGTSKLQLVFYDGKQRDVLSEVSCDVPNQMGCATFSHVVNQPMYQTMLSVFKEAASSKDSKPLGYQVTAHSVEPLVSTVNTAQSAQSMRPVVVQKLGFSTPAVCAIALLVFVSTVLFFSGANNPPNSSGSTPKVAQKALDAGAAGNANSSTANASTLAPSVFATAASSTGVTDAVAEALPAASSMGNQLNDVEKSILTKVVADSGIELAAGGKPFVIFSDPNCPSCRQLEAQLSSMDKSLSPVVVPVSFQRNSAEAVSWILCSPNVTQAWKIAVTAERGVVGEGSCTKGKAQAEANNAAFTALKFDRTPTIVTSSGKVAVGVKDFDGLAKWIKANS